MLKRSLKSCLRRAKAWLAEEEAALECGTPPFDYEGANCFFKKAMKERGLRRPHYAWGAVQALNLAKRLSLPRISLIEFGVAGGLGLTALERIGAPAPGEVLRIDTSALEFIDHRTLLALDQYAARRRATVVLQSAPGIVTRLMKLIPLRALREERP